MVRTSVRVYTLLGRRVGSWVGGLRVWMESLRCHVRMSRCLSGGISESLEFGCGILVLGVGS